MRTRGLKPSELARKAGLSTSYISEILNGKRGRRPSGRVVSALAAALNVDVEHLLDPRLYTHFVRKGENYADLE